MADPIKFIEALQQKPEHVRKIIAAFVVGVLMIFILVFWIYTFSIDNFSEIETASKSAEPSPFALLWGFVKDSATQLYK